MSFYEELYYDAPDVDAPAASYSIETEGDWSREFLDKVLSGAVYNQKAADTVRGDDRYTWVLQCYKRAHLDRELAEQRISRLHELLHLVEDLQMLDEQRRNLASEIDQKLEELGL